MDESEYLDVEEPRFRFRRRKWWLGAILVIVLGVGIVAMVSPSADDEIPEKMEQEHAEFLKKRASFEDTKQLAKERLAPKHSAVTPTTSTTDTQIPSVTVGAVLDALSDMPKPQVIKPEPAPETAPIDAPSPTSDATPPMDERIAMLEAEIARLREAQASAPATVVMGAEDISQLQEAVLVMGKEIASLKEELAEKDAAQPGSVFVDFYLLEREVQAGNPYSNEYDALMQNEATPQGARALLAPLKKDAEDGIPTLDQLKTGFADASHAFFSGQAAQDPKAPMWQRLKNNIRGLVIIRKVGAEQMGSDPASIIARAEAALNQQDVAAAEQEIGSLPARDRPAFADWLVMVDDRLKSFARLDEARALLLAPEDSDVTSESGESPAETRPEYPFHHEEEEQEDRPDPYAPVSDGAVHPL